MKAYPRFRDALRYCVTRPLAFMDRDLMHHRAFADAGQFFIGLVALYLDATGGLTHNRLRELVLSVPGIVSAGRATAVLLQLRVIGYIKPLTRSRTGRVQSYTLMPAMVAAFRTRLRIEIEAAAMLEPEIDRLLARYDEPEVFRTLCTVIGEVLLNSNRQSKPLGSEVFDALAGRRAGMLLVFALLKSADKGGPFPMAGPVTANVAHLSERLGVSRPQILDVIGLMEDAGYYRREGRGPDMITPACCAAFETFYAVILSGVLITANLTLRAVEENDVRHRARRLPSTCE